VQQEVVVPDQDYPSFDLRRDLGPAEKAFQTTTFLKIRLACAIMQQRNGTNAARFRTP
jgi:hypothetical protein